MNWYLKVLQNYAVFSGRARRKEYWYFVLFNLIITMVLAAIDSFLIHPSFSQQYGISLLPTIYSLAVLIPSLAVSVRRLHDIGRSAWWLLLLLMPIIGGIVLLIFALLDSDPDVNEYGPNPKIT